MRRLAVAVAALVLAGAASAPPGAEGCTACHVRGVAVNGGIGLLQGRPAADTVRILEAYRSGQVPATLMDRIVRGFTPEEVATLALWFSAQGAGGVPRP